jgi:glyceraldehyde 3-phosphate dehydrogenase
MLVILLQIVKEGIDMSIRIAINGFGRIGRNIVRAIYESSPDHYQQAFEIVAINDLGSPQINAHLLQFDSVHGRFNGNIEYDDKHLFVNQDKIQLFQQRDPSKLPWQALNIDLVLECTGLFTQRHHAQAHIDAGAHKVLISAPGQDLDATIVYGVNHHTLTGNERIISNASCTTNCLAPLAKILDQAVGIKQGQMTTIHAYTNDQLLTDGQHSDLYRARSATSSMIPTKTGAAAAVGLVLPQLNGRLDGMAIRVPTINVSLVDLTFVAGQETSTNDINQYVKNAIINDPELAHVMDYVDQPLVSIDFNHSAKSSSFDANHTRAQGTLVKVMAWYDNEWGFSNRMLDTSLALMQH